MIDDKYSDERDQIGESRKNMIQNHKNKKLMKDIRKKIQNHLKGLIANKTEKMMILLILILSWRQMWRKKLN